MLTGLAGDGLKIVLTFGRTGGDKEAVSHAGLEWLGTRAGNGGFHATNKIAVGKVIDRNRVRFRDEMPDGQGGMVGLKRGERDDFQFLEPIFLLQAEMNGDDGGVAARNGTSGRSHGATGVRDFDGVSLEPAGEFNDINTR